MEKPSGQSRRDFLKTAGILLTLPNDTEGGAVVVNKQKVEFEDPEQEKEYLKLETEIREASLKLSDKNLIQQRDALIAKNKFINRDIEKKNIDLILIDQEIEEETKLSGMSVYKFMDTKKGKMLENKQKKLVNEYYFLHEEKRISDYKISIYSKVIQERLEKFIDTE